ncbi:hypothetical protein OAJ93_03630, partial [Gammaproteobacteria bacterium]|nr:hypothetical protein [Gammaproteobacteria bacterium]
MFEITINILSFELILALICLFFCAIVQGYSGFGGGLMIVPIMALLFGPVTGIALVAIPFFFGMLVIIP